MLEESKMDAKVSKAFKKSGLPSVFLQMIGRVLESPCSKEELMKYFNEPASRIHHGYYSEAFTELKHLGILLYSKNTKKINLGDNFPLFLCKMIIAYPKLQKFLVKRFTKDNNNSLDFINRIDVED